MTLRRRMLAGVLALVAVGLVVADAATAATLRSFLLHRVDRQLLGARQAIERRVTPPPTTLPSPTASPAAGGRELGPSEFFVEILDKHGKAVLTLPPTLRAERDPPPHLSDTLLKRAIASSGSPVGPVTVAAEAGPIRYRVTVSTVADNQLVVAAVSLRELDTTYRRLVLVEIAVSLGVLVAIALVGLWVVRLGLRPLEHMASTADAIAAGDLSRRVDGAGTDEVGRLASALNAMLSQIEAAFVDRTTSEERLRRFVADASHELRTPLTSIRGYAELFRHGVAGPDDLLPVMRNIEEQAARMGVLVDDLLLLARLDQHRPLDQQPVELAAVARDAVADARAADPGHPLTLTTAGDTWVQGDRHRLRQVLDNLLANARVHTPVDTAVEVTVDANPETSEVALSVRDAGPGMSAEIAGRVFERFYRADPSRARDRGGAGLGLSIVKAVVEAHGGRVELTTAPAQGACFRVLLPAVPGPDAAAELTSNSQLEASPGSAENARLHHRARP